MEITFQPETLVAVLGYQAVLAGKIAFGKAEIMHGIQQVGLTHTVAAADTHQGGGKLKLLVEVVFKLEK